MVLMSVLSQIFTEEHTVFSIILGVLCDAQNREGEVEGFENTRIDFLKVFRLKKLVFIHKYQLLILQ